MEPILKTVADNFITERNSSEVMAVGINSIREITARCPLAMNEDLLADLIEYRTYKDKGVSTAAKSLIAMFREKLPHMLHKRMRGRPTEAVAEQLEKAKAYGDLDAKEYIPGAEIVAVGDDEDEEANWEECSDSEDEKKPKGRGKKRKHSEEDDDDSDGEWIDVSDEEGKAGEENPELAKLTLEEKRRMATEISTQKIFTQEDFQRIRAEEQRKKLTDKNYTRTKDQGRIKNITIDSDSESEEAKAAKR